MIRKTFNSPTEKDTLACGVRIKAKFDHLSNKGSCPNHDH